MTRPLRVLQIANQASPLRLFVLPVCEAMRQAGATVELACMGGGPNYGRLVESPFTVHALPTGAWSDPRTYWRVYRAVRAILLRGKYDLMIAHTPVMSWIARYAARDCVGAVVYMAHGLPFAPQQAPPVRWLLRKIEQFAGRYTDAILVMNQVDADACRRFRLTRSGGRWFLLPGVGVNIEGLREPLTDAQRRALDAEFGLSPDRPVAVFLGRFIPTKRPGDILELARRTGPAVQYLVAGDGPLWADISREAARIGDHVHVLGWTERTSELVRRADLALFPSIFREGLPRFLLEVQAAGKPAVAYDVRGTADAIVHEQTGLLVPPGDVDAFCSAARRLLDDASLRTKLGLAGSARVVERFSLAAAVAAQMAAVEEITSHAGLGRN